MLNAQLKKLTEWLNKREPRERVGILFLTCLFITVVWYLFIEKPIMESRLQIQQETVATAKQLAFYTNQSNMILMEHTSEAQQKKAYSLSSKKFQSLNIQFASPQGRDFIVNAILKPKKDIQIISMKNVPFTPVKKLADKTAINTQEEGYELVFKSDYPTTVSFLETLENLPWCLSWDSLEYVVQNYPTGQIKIDLHVVSA